MITYEVVMRYVFLAPTIWAEELSRFFQIWATYIAAAYVLRHRQLIAITILVNRLGPLGRRLAESRHHRVQQRQSERCAGAPEEGPSGQMFFRDEHSSMLRSVADTAPH